jgi:hypothetical protein
VSKGLLFSILNKVFSLANRVNLTNLISQAWALPHVHMSLLLIPQHSGAFFFYHVTMLSLNLFAQKAKSYRRLSTSTEGEGDTCISPGVSAQKEEHDADEDLLLAKRLRRPWHWSCMHICGYLFVALLSFLVGLGLSQLFTLEKEVDGFIGMFAPYRLLCTSRLSLRVAFFAILTRHQHDGAVRTVILTTCGGRPTPASRRSLAWRHKRLGKASCRKVEASSNTPS